MIDSLLDQRKSFLLQAIIEEYVLTAEPIGSKFLVQKYDMGVSPATVRNDMCLLEKDGYLIAPHPSAGRIPSQKGYRYYLDHFLRVKRGPQIEAHLRIILQTQERGERLMKQIAKVLGELSGEMIIVAFDPHWSYYTGVSNLFHKPDFAQLGLVYSLSELIDQFDEVIASIFSSITQKPQVFVGDENPFGKEMSAILTRYEGEDESEGLLGIVGPLRMDYAKNVGLLEEVNRLLKESV